MVIWIVVQSACADSMTTKWNRYNIGQTLKDWIKSIAKRRDLPKEYKKLIFSRKTVAIFNERGSFSNGNSEGGNDVILINNKKCSEEKNHEPPWRKASNFIEILRGIFRSPQIYLIVNAQRRAKDVLSLVSLTLLKIIVNIHRDENDLAMQVE